jgi:hypothetical protein
MTREKNMEPEVIVSTVKALLLTLVLVVPYLAFSRKRLELMGFFEGAFHVCGVGVGVILASCLVFFVWLP